jgi:hypothetical protein
MPQARRSTTAAKRRPRALNTLEKSIDSAQGAIKDLRSDLGRGGRDLVKELDKALADARKNLRSLTQAITKELEQVQRAATSRGRPGGRKKAAARKSPASRKRTGARKTAARKSTTARKKTPARKKTARRKTTRKKAARTR